MAIYLSSLPTLDLIFYHITIVWDNSGSNTQSQHGPCVYLKLAYVYIYRYPQTIFIKLFSTESANQGKHEMKKMYIGS